MTLFPAYPNRGNLLNMQSYNELSIQSWDENADSWDNAMGDGSPFQRQIVDPIIDKLIFPIDDRTDILEIGCGNGFLAKRFAQHGARVSAFDASENAISNANKRLNKEDNINYFVADATDIETYSKLNQKFDVVICNMAFMDIAEITPVFQGVKNKLKNGG